MLIFGIILGRPAHSQEFMPPPTKGLLMIHSPLCGYCTAFLRDTNKGETYNKTDIGKVYPLIIMNTNSKDVREWIRSQTARNGPMKRIRGTPTFIFWKNAKEIGRVTGYGGTDWFYQAIENEFRKIDK